MHDPVELEYLLLPFSPTSTVAVTLPLFFLLSIRLVGNDEEEQKLR